MNSTLLDHILLSIDARENNTAAVIKTAHENNDVILDDSFSDDTGVYHKGDFILCKPRDKHSPTTVNTDFLCLAALEAPLTFNNAFY